MEPRPFTVSVVICAFTEERWDQLKDAVEGVQGQTLQPIETIVVIDHNPDLLERAQKEIPAALILPSKQVRGASGSRNTGVEVAKGDLIAFMDEDAVPSPTWLDELVRGYTDPSVIGVGGAIDPAWAGERPRWFPDEFDWVVGCTYRGLPTTTANARNLIGCNMSFRRELFDAGERFRVEIGRIGTIPVGCEETEFCIRTLQNMPGRRLLYEPRSKVCQRVPPRRMTWGYFTSRCYAEGISKAQIAELVGAGDGLASERNYTFSTLPRGVIRNLSSIVLRGDPAGLLRAGAIIAGLAVTTVGYIRGKWARSAIATRRIRLENERL